MLEEYDVFLSHASADKDAFVEELKKSFDNLGIKVFYDKDSIEWGDNWKDRILTGLQNCRFGVIVISDNFIGRKWPEKELQELLTRQNTGGQKLILPILYNVSAADLHKTYKKLSEIQFIEAKQFDVKDITIKLARVLLNEQSQQRKSISNNIIFEAFFDRMCTIDFFEWIDQLVQNGNQWIDEYDTSFIGWNLLKIEGRNIPLMQHKDKEPPNISWYDGYSRRTCLVYRINPIYYHDFCEYFEKNIRPQM